MPLSIDQLSFSSACRDVTSIYLGSVSAVCPVKMRSKISESVIVTFFLVRVVGFPAKIHCTAVYALRNGKFSRLLGIKHPSYSHKSRPCWHENKRRYKRTPTKILGDISKGYIYQGCAKNTKQYQLYIHQELIF